MKLLFVRWPVTSRTDGWPEVWIWNFSYSINLWCVSASVTTPNISICLRRKQLLQRISSKMMSRTDKVANWVHGPTGNVRQSFTRMSAKFSSKRIAVKTIKFRHRKCSIESFVHASTIQFLTKKLPNHSILCSRSDTNLSQICEKSRQIKWHTANAHLRIESTSAIHRHTVSVMNSIATNGYKNRRILCDSSQWKPFRIARLESISMNELGERQWKLKTIKSDKSVLLIYYLVAFNLNNQLRMPYVQIVVVVVGARQTAYSTQLRFHKVVAHLERFPKQI